MYSLWNGAIPCNIYHALFKRLHLMWPHILKYEPNPAAAEATFFFIMLVVYWACGLVRRANRHWLAASPNLKFSLSFVPVCLPLAPSQTHIHTHRCVLINVDWLTNLGLMLVCMSYATCLIYVCMCIWMCTMLCLISLPMLCMFKIQDWRFIYWSWWKYVSFTTLPHTAQHITPNKVHNADMLIPLRISKATLLYITLLCSIVLYCTLLYCIVLHSTLDSTALYSSLLHSTPLHSTLL